MIDLRRKNFVRDRYEEKTLPKLLQSTDTTTKRLLIDRGHPRQPTRRNNK